VRGRSGGFGSVSDAAEGGVAGVCAGGAAFFQPEEERLAFKIPEASFLHVLQSEFNLSPREAQEVVNTTREMLGLDCPSDQVRPEQVRLVVASLEVPFGPPMSETDRVEVTLTADGGPEEAEVKARQGRKGLRRGRILRVLDKVPLIVNFWIRGNLRDTSWHRVQAQRAGRLIAARSGELRTRMGRIYGF
jgi:hypothetical protein